ncbi:lateral flagellar hook-associated protein 2 [Rubrivivax gelatinosus]|uniref:flagellar filament capping protein FliD n=1 Tax=Rubrivivax gelatinosus TaxID=28068 RepID=UPI0019075BE6|nr:flagellar filament capping protein FliD [Rubrivivax gelatinosus]MBK1616119.1 lateral flagellar hook-associated protein 2 [Rubrivivax gelatinosus]
MSTIEPTTLAQQLATSYTQNERTLLSTRSSAAQATSTALGKLKTALTTFDGVLSTLSSSKGVKALSASFATSGYASATATTQAAAGNYSFFVEQLATTHQTSFAAVPSVAVAGAGKLGLTVGSNHFEVDLAAADSDGDGQVSASEIARAVNASTDNGGKLVASVLTVGGQSQLVLTAGESGAAGAITLDTAALGSSALKTALGTEKLLVQGRDAVAWLGEQGSGVRIQQGSNTYTGISGVSVVFSKAMSSGDTPITLTVANDASATASNLKTFVDAYNTLEKLLDDMTANANASNGTSAGAFASDSAVLSLKNRLAALVRQNVGGVRLADYGVSIDRGGQMSIDQSKLEKGLAAKADGLNTLFGSARAGSSSGLLGSLSDLADRWRNADGQIAGRQTSIEKTQKSLTERQEALEIRYESMYQRYLKQFTKLQELQTTIGETSSLFSNLS